MNHGFFSFYGFLALSPVNCVFIILIGNSLCRGTFGRQKETPSGLHGEIAWAPCTPYIRSYRTHCPNQSLLVLAVCITSTLLGYFSSPKQVGLKLFTLRYNCETIRPAWRWPTAPKTRFFSKATPQKDLLARQAEHKPGSTTEIDGDKHPYTRTLHRTNYYRTVSAPGSGKVPYIRKNGKENRVVKKLRVQEKFLTSGRTARRTGWSRTGRLGWFWACWTPAGAPDSSRRSDPQRDSPAFGIKGVNERLNREQWQAMASTALLKFRGSGFQGERFSQYPRAVAIDEPVGGAWVGSFEHGLLEPEPAYDLCNDVCPQGVGALANVISVDHDHICSCFQASLRPPNQQVNVFNSFCKTGGHKLRFLSV